MFGALITVGLVVAGAVGAAWGWQKRAAGNKSIRWGGLDLRLAGGLAGALIGFALGGPVGMLVGGLGLGSLGHWGASQANKAGLLPGNRQHPSAGALPRN